jgi:Icc-related predicted phosphoesterase
MRRAGEDFEGDSTSVTTIHHDRGPPSGTKVSHFQCVKLIPFEPVTRRNSQPERKVRSRDSRQRGIKPTPLAFPSYATRCAAIALGKRRGQEAAPKHPVALQPSTLSLLVFSDARVQDLSILAEYVASLDPRPDLILYAGDDVDRFHPENRLNYFAKLAGLTTYGLAAVIGNDDAPNASRFLVGRRVYDAHARTLLLGQFAVIGLAGAPIRESEFNRGSTLFTESALRARLRRGLKAAGERIIIVLSHAPPNGTLDFAVRFGARRIGSQAVSEALDSPDSNIHLVVCGHVHGMGGRDEQRGRALVLNAASHDGPLSPLRIGRVTIRTSMLGIEVLPVVWEELSPVRHLATGGRTDRDRLNHVSWTASDLQRVDQVGWIREQRLQHAGISSLKALACAPPMTVAAALKVGIPRAQAFVTRARAVHLKKAIALGPLTISPRPRVFVDVETDLAQMRVWMCGCLDSRTGEFEQFSSSSFEPSEECAMLNAIAKWLDERVDSVILHYSGSDFDGRMLRSGFTKYGVVCSVSRNFVDVLPMIRRAIAPPCGNYALKQIAECAGYRFRHPQLDGFAVASTYADRVRVGKKAIITRDLLEYNEDDVRSIERVCAWTEQYCAMESTTFTISPSKHRLA